MTISDLTRRVIAYWWIIVATCVAFTLLLFPWSSDVQYVASITVGINFNDPSLSDFDQSQVSYVESFEQISLYIEQRFSSIEIQSIINQEGELGRGSLSNGNPFYEVENQGAGFVNLALASNNRGEAERFLVGAKAGYNQVINEWNSSRQDEFRIQPMTSFSESVVEVIRPIQFQLLPVFSGLLIGVVLIMILPLPQKKAKKSA
jgi:hypothetical protein